jgi:hypothetical protein
LFEQKPKEDDLVEKYRLLAEKISQNPDQFENFSIKMKALMAEILSQLKPESKMSKQIKITEQFIDILLFALQATDE